MDGEERKNVEPKMEKEKEREKSQTEESTLKSGT